jgi:hypothetical protein
MAIHFSTPGKLDLRCLTTFGVNVKPNAEGSPIGYFGTGLKYAVAVLLRHKAKLSLTTGGQTYAFRTDIEDIRGKDFDLCSMVKTSEPREMEPNIFSLPFTLELGKDWTLENAYRELYSNTKDEQGRVTSGECPTLAQFPTVLSVELEAFDKVHANKDSFILDQTMTPIYKTDKIEVYPYPSKAVFYRGIAVYEGSKPYAFTYNLLKQLTLNENRTASHFSVSWDLADAIATCPDKHLVQAALLHDGMEHELSYDYAPKGEVFMDTLAALVKTHGTVLGENAVRVFYTSAKAAPQWETIEPTAEQLTAYTSMVNKIRSCGIDITYPVKISQDLGLNVLARAYQGAIWLTPKVFNDPDLLIAALLEEYVHLRYSVADETRAMQNAIFTVLANVIQVKGEPNG